MVSAVTLGLMAVTLALAAMAQRVTGFGLALVSSPLLVVLGPSTAVPLLQVLGIVTAALILVRVYRDVEWVKLPWLLVSALVGVWLGAWVAGLVAGPLLEVFAGVLVVGAVLATVVSDRARVFTGRGGAAAAGWLAGFMNAIAGVGGPAMVLYKLSINWPQRPFVATLQVFFLCLSVFTLVARGWPQLDARSWVVGVAGLVAGLVAGGALAGRMSEDLARILVVIVALGGGAATLVHGVAAL